MEKHFDHFFPPGTYRPLDYIRIENQDIVITRLKYDAIADTYTHHAAILKPSMYSYMTSEEGVICASITVPTGKVVDVVKSCNDDSHDIITSICGPVKCMYTNQGLFSSNNYLRCRDIDSNTYYNQINENLIECQKKLVVRLYSEPLFNNFQFTESKYKDIVVSTELEYPNFLRYKSMIIPYGLYLDDAGELVPGEADPTTFSMKGGRLYGPCIISDTSQLYTYFKQSYIHEPVDDVAPIDVKVNKDSISKIINDIIPPKTIVVSNKRVKVIVKLSHYMYKHLKPLFGIYILSNCLGQEYTDILKEECTWKIDDNEINKLTFYWLNKMGGDYSYVACIYNNPKYRQVCGKILSLYSKKTQYTGSPSPPSPRYSPT